MPNNVDYASTYFKYPVTSPINGEPTNKSLKQLNTKLRANNSSVETYLGGGDHGYLGLLLTDAEYTRINPTSDPFVTPNFPAALVIIPNLASVEAVNVKESHKEAMRIYRECKNVEKTLLRHIQTALEKKHRVLIRQRHRTYQTRYPYRIRVPLQ